MVISKTVVGRRTVGGEGRNDKRKHARKSEVSKLCDSLLSRFLLDIADDEIMWEVLMRQVTVKVDPLADFSFHR